MLVASLVEYPGIIHNPFGCGTRCVDCKALKRSLVLCNDDDRKAALQALRADGFERAYVVCWLNGLVHQAPLLSHPLEDSAGSGNSYYVEEKFNTLIHLATALIAVCAGSAALRTLTRQYALYAPSLEADVDISFTDLSISVDADSMTVGTQTWLCACLIAEMWVEEPGKFGLTDEVRSRAEGMRVLELGAGTCLVSIPFVRLRSWRYLCLLQPLSRSLLVRPLQQGFPPL